MGRKLKCFDLNALVNLAIFKILLLLMNSNVCILYVGIFCIHSIYDGIGKHRITNMFFSADEYSSSCASGGHGLCRYFPVVHTSCKIHSGTRRGATVEYKDFSGVRRFHLALIISLAVKDQKATLIFILLCYRQDL